MIQALIPIALEQVESMLLQELEDLGGRRYAREGGHEGLVRRGRQQGSVYLLDQKVRIQVPRVRDLSRGREVRLETYPEFQAPQAADRSLFGRVLGGLSCRNYGPTSRLDPESFALSPSTISRRFIRASSARLKEMRERRLDGHEFVAVFMDGKLLVLDGAKGLRKAVSSVFGRKTPVQRCPWRQRENAISHLPKSRQAAMRGRLIRAQEIPDYEKAKAALLKIHRELLLENESAAKSLLEGLEETLTPRKPGLFRELARSLKTTNVLESIQSGIGQRTANVDHWKNINQLHRWAASALLEIEPGLRRVCGFQHLYKLRDALQGSNQARAVA